MAEMIKKDPVLSVKDLKVSFSTYAGEVQAVRGVTWELGREETIAIVGESGCGKTVSIQTAMGLLAKPAGRIKEGSIIFDGKDITNYTAKQMRWIQGNEMTMIFQDPLTYLNPTMRVGRQIAEAYLQHHPGMKKKDAEERVLEFMRKVSLPNPEENMRRYPHELSGGMRQRVGIAMAMTFSPRLLLADEPTSALDVTTQAQIIRQIVDVRNEYNAAVILVTHNLGVASYMSNKIIVMKGGRVVESGPREQVLFHPRDEYTKTLLDSVPVIGGETYYERIGE